MGMFITSSCFYIISSPNILVGEVQTLEIFATTNLQRFGLLTYWVDWSGFICFRIKTIVYWPTSELFLKENIKMWPACGRHWITPNKWQVSVTSSVAQKNDVLLLFREIVSISVKICHYGSIFKSDLFNFSAPVKTTKNKRFACENPTY